MAKDKETKKGSKLIIAFIIVLIVIAVVIGLVAYFKSTQRDNTANENTQETESETLVSESEPEPEPEPEKTGVENIAIFGVDTRGNNLGKGTRSDTVMIVSIDHDAKTVKIASVFRDCMVRIEGHGYEKITHAHSYGGPELAMRTINENFDLQISNYVTVNFNSVGDLVDQIGGIEQDLTAEEVGIINGYIDEVNKVRNTSSAHITAAGTYTLDGTQAVAFTRIRYTEGGDYKRSERQRTILFKIFEKAKSLDTADRISLAENMLSEINTNYQLDEIAVLLKGLSDYQIVDMAAYPQVFYGGKVEGAWVEVPVTLNDMVISMHGFLFGNPAYVPSETVNGISTVLQGKVSGANNDLRENQ